MTTIFSRQDGLPQVSRDLSQQSVAAGSQGAGGGGSIGGCLVHMLKVENVSSHAAPEPGSAPNVDPNATKSQLASLATKSATGSDALQGTLTSADAVAKLQESYANLKQELAKVIVGQQGVLEELIVAVLAGGHCLIVGVPGLGKTLMVRTLAETLGLSFNRIQFTPDLMPADITGTEVIQEDKLSGLRELRFLHGPVFANIVLADEINRTPPKTQAALLEAMQEHQVTIGGHRHPLPEPFFVLATQNPIEQEGTYPLPEAQRDRFLFEVRIDYPEEQEEFEIVRRTTSRKHASVQRVLDAETLAQLQGLVRDVPVADHVIYYAMALVRATRRAQGEVPKFVQDYVTWGAGPRASQSLILAAKGRAVLQGRDCVGISDVQAVAVPVLRHRVITNFAAEADGITSDEIVRRLIESIPTDPAASHLADHLAPLIRVK
ncbi:MAG: MoxR family ATPase [Planctomycetaceae bacterium]